MKELMSKIESIVFVSGAPVEIKDIAEKLAVAPGDVLAAAKELQARYSGGCGLHLLVFNSKLQLCSNPQNAAAVEEVLSPIRERELSRAMMEVCAIIAYRQPITRLEIEELRGVGSDYSIAVLQKQNMIEVVGRKDAIGKPLLFGTTDEFLKRFELSALADLPDYDDLLERIRVLHQPPSADLFFKEEYNPNNDPAVDTQAVQTDGQEAAVQEATMEAAAAVEAESPALEEENLGGEGESQAEEDGGQSEFDLEGELPEFLAGESDIQRIE